MFLNSYLLLSWCLNINSKFFICNALDSSDSIGELSNFGTLLVDMWSLSSLTYYLGDMMSTRIKTLAFSVILGASFLLTQGGNVPVRKVASSSVMAATTGKGTWACVKAMADFMYNWEGGASCAGSSGDQARYWVLMSACS